MEGKKFGHPNVSNVSMMSSKLSNFHLFCFCFVLSPENRMTVLMKIKIKMMMKMMKRNKTKRNGTEKNF